jgi:hypothetical protein
MRRRELDGKPAAVDIVSNRKLPAQNAFIAEASDPTSGLARAALRIDGRHVASGARLSYRPKKGWGGPGRHDWWVVAFDGAGNRRETGGIYSPTPGNITWSCRRVQFEPRSDYGLYRIKAKGIFCEAVRRKLFAWKRNGFRPKKGPRGFRCRVVRRYRAGNHRYSCRGGKKVISFDTGL